MIEDDETTDEGAKVIWEWNTRVPYGGDSGAR